MAGVSYTKSDLLEMSVEDLLKLQNDIKSKNSNIKSKNSSSPTIKTKKNARQSNPGFSKLCHEKLKHPNEEDGISKGSIGSVKDRLSRDPISSVIKTGKNAAPVEMSLTRKKPPPLWKNPTNVLKSKTRLVRDPRFDDLSGKLDMVAWSKNYQFLDDMKKKERSVLLKELKSTDDAEARQRIKLALQALDNTSREKRKIDQRRLMKKAEWDSTIDALKEGKRPYIKKKSEVKLEMLAKQFHGLKKEKRLDKYLERKEKKRRAQELFKK